jgi:Ca2+-binding EF-hand superfamily protein
VALLSKVLDGDGDGKISVGDFRYFMTTLGEKMSDEEVEEMLSSVYKRKHENFDSIEYNGKVKYKFLLFEKDSFYVHIF